jgi:hypothetical protein
MSQQIACLLTENTKVNTRMINLGKEIGKISKLTFD